jgi:ribosomal protein L11 methyltransferase
MKASFLWQISITTSPEAEDAVTLWLGELFGSPASSYTDFETRSVTVTVCVTQRPRWDRAARRRLVEGIVRIRGCGLDVGVGTVALARIARRSWAESWKRHFPPLEIGTALLLKPSWSRRRAREGQAVIVLDPGLSFGTGRHPTTAFCLHQLVERCRRGQTQSFLDIGTGSGILAIAAAKLGYKPIRAFDFDPDSVRTARQNAVRNRVSDRVRLTRYDVTRLSSQAGKGYSLVCANLISNLLRDRAETIVARVGPGGVLVLAGILKEEFSKVREAYEAAGLRLVASRVEQEWRSGAFRRPRESRTENN